MERRTLRALVVFVMAFAVASAGAQSKDIPGSPRPDAKRISEFDLGIVRLLLRNFGVRSDTLLLHRSKISEKLDLVIAPANAAPVENDKHAWHGAGSKLGLFLQDRGNAGLIYQLVVEDGRADCIERVARATTSEIVLSCERASTGVGPNRKYIYSASGKKMLRQFDYEPYTLLGIFAEGKNFIFLGSNTVKPAAFEYAPATGAFRALSGDQAMKWNARLQKDAESAKCPFNTPTRQGSNPCREGGGRIVIGESFYVGEAKGGLSWLDQKTHAAVSRKPEAMNDASVTAILPEAEKVWLGLAIRKPEATTPAGLLEFNFATGKTNVTPLHDYINAIARSGKSLLLAADSGIAILEDNKVRRYFVDQSPDGKLSVVLAQ